MARKPPSSRSFVVLGGVAALALLAAAWWWLGAGGERGGGGSRPVASTAPSADRGATLPAALAELAEASRLEGSAEDAAAAVLAHAGEAAARIVVHGRVVMADGGRLPDDLLLSATPFPPYPRRHGPHLERLEWFSGAADATEDELREQTRTRPAADGAFTMQGVPADGAWLRVEHELCYGEPVALREGEEALVVLLHGACIEGRVLDERRRPLAGAEVSGRSDFDPFAILSEGITIVEVEETESDEQGRFVLRQVVPGIGLTVRAGSEGRSPARVAVPALSPGRRETVELVLLPGASLAGVVLDDDEHPVEGAEVRLSPARMSLGELEQMDDRYEKREDTDTQGRFVFDGLPAGEYQVVLAAQGYRPVQGETLELQPGEARDDVLLRASRGLSVAGRVVDGDGAPVAGAEVAAFRPPSLVSMRANLDRTLRHDVETDADGRFELHGYDDGPLKVRAEADGFVATTVDAAAGDDEVLVALGRRASLSGVAVKLADAEPLVAYTLSFSPSGNLFDPTRMFDVEERLLALHGPERVSDPEGRFTVGDVAPGRYDLTVTADGYARTTLPGVEVAAGEAVTGLVFLVPEQATVSGTVVSGRDGRPLEDATVATGRQDLFSRMSQMMLPGGADGVRTGPDGRFELAGLPPGELKLSVAQRDHVTLGLPEVVVRAGESLDLGVLTLSAGASVWGDVRDADGEPVPRATVLVSSGTGQSFKRGVTDDDGRYDVWGLSPGGYQVMRMDFEIDLTGDNPASAVDGMVVRTIELAADERKRVDLLPDDDRGTRLSGTVSSKGVPENGAMIWLVPERDGAGASLRMGHTDERGHYEIGGLGPGTWLMQVLPSGEVAMGSGSAPVAPVIERVTIADVPQQRHDVEVPGGVLAGSVHERGSLGGIAGVRVLLERTDAGLPDSPLLQATGGRVGEGFTDGEGRFRFGHLAPGTYDVVAGGSNVLGLGEAGWAATRVAGLSVHEGRSSPSVRIELEPGGGVRGVLTGPGGQRLPGVAVWARDERSGSWLSTLSEAVSDDSGAFEVNSLSPGPWTFAFGGDDWALTLVGPRTVSAGSVLELDVELQRGVEVFVDVAPHDPATLRASAVGAGGELPLHLSSLGRLMGGSRNDGSRLRLGRIAPGAYDLTVWSGAEVVFSAGRTVTAADDPLVLTLEE